MNKNIIFFVIVIFILLSSCTDPTTGLRITEFNEFKIQNNTNNTIILVNISSITQLEHLCSIPGNRIEKGQTKTIKTNKVMSATTPYLITATASLVPLAYYTKTGEIITQGKTFVFTEEDK